MIKQIIEISSGPTRLSVRHTQLVINLPAKGEVLRPIEDLGILILDHPAITYTQAVLQSLAANNTAVLICGTNHLPIAMLLPLMGNSLQTERLASQINIRVPLKKQLWKTIVCEKIRRQAELLRKLGKSDSGLKNLIRQVRSGDPTNVESQAARKYWKILFEEITFKRDRFGGGINAALNYGYAVLRAAVARAICGAGLHPSIGIHHHNRYNAFCLADDLLEPFRPLADEEVYRIWKDQNDFVELDKGIKAKLLSILNREVILNKLNMPLLEALHRMAASLVRTFESGKNRLEIPKW